MRNPSEIVDETFGKLVLVDEQAYFSEVSWNRGLDIRLYIHVDCEDYKKCIDDAITVFALVRKNEMELFNRGVKYLISRNEIVEDDDLGQLFLDSAAETSVEINSNGKGQLVYLVMMLGSLIIEFSHDAGFENARVIPG